MLRRPCKSGACVSASLRRQKTIFKTAMVTETEEENILKNES